MDQRLNRAIFFLIPLALMMLTPWQLGETSLWIGYGKHLWADWHFLYSDHFSLLPTDNNTTCAWLPSLIYYGLFSLGRFTAVAIFHFAVLLFALEIVYKKSLFLNQWPWPPWQRFAVYFMWFGSSGFYSLRPALLAFIPFILSYNILEKAAQKQEPLSWKSWNHLALLQVLWVNIHGSFILLPIMIFFYLLNIKFKPAKQLAGASRVLIATLANPFGAGVYSYVLKTKSYGELLGVSEWVSPFSSLYPVQTVCYWILVAIFAFTVFKNRKILLSPFTPLILLPLLGLRASVFGFFAFPVFLASRTPVFEAKPHDFRGRSGAILVVIALLVLCTFSFPQLKPQIAQYLPLKYRDTEDENSVIKIAERIRQEHHDACAILNDFNVGGFLLGTTENPLLIDGRLTPFTKDALTQYRDLMTLENRAGPLLERYRPCFVVLPKGTKLIDDLVYNFHFKYLESEKNYVLLSR